MTLSTIITYYNQDPNILVDHIKLCCNSTVLPNEIIVINDGGKIDPLNLLRSHSFSIPIRYIKITEDIPWNQPGARNAGIFLSAGTYISLEDLDCFPRDNYYCTGLMKIQQSNKSRFHSNAIITSGGIYDYNPGNGIFRRTSIVSVGGLDEAFCGNYGFDDVWFNHILDRKFGPPELTQETLVDFNCGGATYNSIRNSNINHDLLKHFVNTGIRSSGILKFHYTVINDIRE